MSKKKPYPSVSALELKDRLGTENPVAAVLAESLSESDASAVLADSNQVHRLTELCARAPGLIPSIAGLPGLAASIAREDQAVWKAPGDAASPAAFSAAHERLRLAMLAGVALGDISAPDASKELCAVSQAVVECVCQRMRLSFSVGAAGLSSAYCSGPNGDLAIVLAAESDDALKVDLEAHALLGYLEGLRHFGIRAQISVQRVAGHLSMPAGGLSGVQRALLDGAEFLNANSPRWFFGKGLAETEHWPLTPQNLRLLMEHKSDLERAVPLKYRRRNILDGEGGLNDLWWLVNLHEWRYPTATGWALNDLFGPAKARDYDTAARLRALQSAQLITPIEAELLVAAYRHLLDIWYRLALIGHDEPVVPENPLKLAALADGMGLSDGNEVLRLHEGHVDALRAIYSDCMERLRA